MPNDDKEPSVIKIPPSGPLATTSSTTISTIRVWNDRGSPVTGPPVDPLETIEYEAGMFFGTVDIVLNDLHRFEELLLRNAVVEDAVLHARNLCGVFLEDNPRKDDIVLSQLFPDWADAKYKTIRAAVSRLREAYGDKKAASSHQFAFNKMVMHTTNVRGAYGLYHKPLSDLEPIIREIVSEIESLTGVQFKPIR